MNKIKIFITLLAVCLAVNLPYAYADNGQPVDKLENDRFSLADALTGVQYINEWLKSFHELTKLTADRISPEEKQQVGNLGIDMQTIGFYNWVKSVEGTLCKQEYEIRKLEYELALERNASGKVSQAEVDEKEISYQKARITMQNFITKFHIAD
ncbi:MAG: hypothetical protein H6Q71_2423 [Firmicutes bacterium]|nr:hypothetical protein [Bacillota bacterium]